MANTDAPCGFWPIRHLAGGEIRTNSYTATTSATIYKGDLLKVVANGTVEIGAADIGIAAIGIAAEHIASASAGQLVQVYDDPYIVFGVQCDSGTAAAATDVFYCTDHVATTGNTSTGISKNELDSSELAAGAALQLRVIGLVDMPDNAWGEHAKVEVIFNEHLFNKAGATL
jgi:hypothetical protein